MARADGSTARFAAIGDVSDDWGGGAWVGNRAGDTISRSVIERQAEEIVLIASDALERLSLGDSAAAPVPVVLGGGVLAAGCPLLVNRVIDGLAVRLSGAVPKWVTDPPSLGVGLTALGSANIRGTLSLSRTGRSRQREDVAFVTPRPPTPRRQPAAARSRVADRQHPVRRGRLGPPPAGQHVAEFGHREAPADRPQAVDPDERPRRHER